jgi:hypothetical protein
LTFFSTLNEYHRAWRAAVLSAGVSISVSAKAYRLLRAVLHTEVDDDVIRRNPCRIKGADREHARWSSPVRQAPGCAGTTSASAGWSEAVAAVGAPRLHFHDLRHAGNAFAAKVPRTAIRDLMGTHGSRLGPRGDDLSPRLAGRGPDHRRRAPGRVRGRPGRARLSGSVARPWHASTGRR